MGTGKATTEVIADRWPTVFDRLRDQKQIDYRQQDSAIWLATLVWRRASNCGRPAATRRWVMAARISATTRPSDAIFLIGSSERLGLTLSRCWLRSRKKVQAARFRRAPGRPDGTCYVSQLGTTFCLRDLQIYMLAFSAVCLRFLSDVNSCWGLVTCKPLAFNSRC